MSIRNITTLVLALCLVSACNREWFMTHNGNMPSNDRIEQIRVGQSKSDVLKVLGAPSSVVALDRDTWIYMSADVEKIAFFEPKEVARDVLTLKFKDDQIVEMKRLTEKDGQKIAVSTDKTETLGHTPGFFAKFFGGSKTFSPIAPSAGGPM